MHNPITASLEEHRFGVFQNSLKRPKDKLVLVCFGSVLVLCVTQMYTVQTCFFLQYCVVCFIISSLSPVLWFSCLPSGFACNYCWSQVLNADFILPGDGQHNFICIVQDSWLCGSPLMNWQASASSNIFCLSQVLLLHSEKSRDFMKLWFSTAGERRPSSWSTKHSQAV